MKYILLLSSLLFTVPLLAQDKESAAYCSYATEQAEAQAILLKSPTAIAGITQPNTGTTPQIYSGVIESAVGWRKAGLLRKSALKDCALYSETADVNMKIQNALPELQKAALTQRVVQLMAAINRLDIMIDRMSPTVDVHNTTISQLYVLQIARSKLELDKSNTELQIAQIQLPEIPEASLSSLLSKKWTGELAKQDADAKLATAETWDLRLEGGLHQQIHPFIAGKPGFYGTAIFEYNFGAKKRARALEAASRNFQVWKYEQKNDAVQEAVILQKQITAGIIAEQEQLVQLKMAYSLIERKLEVTDQVNSKESISFGIQLIVDQISTKVEIGNTEFRIAQLQQYLQDNF